MPVLTTPDYKERVVFFGANGSGKTTLARAMLDRIPRYVVIDSKGDFDHNKSDTVIEDVTDKRIQNGSSPRIIVSPNAGQTSGRALDYVLKQCYIRGKKYGKTEPFVVYVDEALYLSRTNRREWLGALAVAGRSLNIGLWCASQRTKWIPVEVKSEAWRIYVFYLGYEDDELEILKMSKGSISLQGLQQSTTHHSFLEIRRDPYQAGKMQVQRFPPIKPDTYV